MTFLLTPAASADEVLAAARMIVGVAAIDSGHAAVVPVRV